MARVLKAEGNSLYSCVLPDKRTVTVQLQDRFRNTIWIRRGGYVLVDLTPTEEHKGKVTGDIVNIVREEKEWRKQSYWYVFFFFLVLNVTYSLAHQRCTTGQRSLPRPPHMMKIRMRKNPQLGECRRQTRRARTEARNTSLLLSLRGDGSWLLRLGGNLPVFLLQVHQSHGDREHCHNHS